MIAEKYSIDKLIGKGQFGSVYSGIYKIKQEPIAIKFESIRAPIKLLRQEVIILQYLYSKGSKITPRVHWFGIWSNYTCLVMPLYDDSFQYKTMTPVTMVQCISMLEVIHSFQVLHCDIKPQNIMYREQDLFLIDFGLATFYNETIQTRPMKRMIGSSKYASYFLHCGEPLSKRDDLLSLGYIYYYKTIKENFTNSNATITDEYKTDLLHPINQHWKQIKEWSTLKETIIDKDKALFDYFYYCYRLQSTTQPNYNALKQLFTEAC